jgi:hypothetical protein
VLKTTLLFVTLLTSSLAFAGIHDACHTEKHDSRVFAVAYAGAVIDLKADETRDGKKVYQMPALDYEQAFERSARSLTIISNCGTARHGMR